MKTTVQLKNNIPTSGYSLFGRREEQRDQEICKIAGDSCTSCSEFTDCDDEREHFLNNMASKYDKGKFRSFRKNHSGDNWEKKPRNRMDNKDRQYTRKDRAWRSKENNRHGRKKRYSNYKSNGFEKEDKSNWPENIEKNTKYGKRRDFKRREINQFETAEQDSDKSEEENEYSSEQSEDTGSDGSTSTEEAAEINCIEGIIATTSEIKGLASP